MKINLDKRILENKKFLIDVNNCRCIHRTYDHLKLTPREKTVLKLKYIDGLLMVDIIDQLPRIKRIRYRGFVYSGAISKQMGDLIYKRALSKIKKTFEYILFTDLREYVKDNGSSPFYRKNNGFPHSVHTYVSHFGSISKAMIYCGIKSNGYFKNDNINIFKKYYLIN